eukprot:229894-Amphidinium_carterae.1
MFPVIIGKCPGLVATIVVTGDVPLLSPSPLLARRAAEINYTKEMVLWTQDHTQSELVALPSAHVLGAERGPRWICFRQQLSRRYKPKSAES